MQRNSEAARTNALRVTGCGILGSPGQVLFTFPLAGREIQALRGDSAELTAGGQGLALSLTPDLTVSRRRHHAFSGPVP